MLKTLSLIPTLFIALSTSAVFAADRVVVLPLNSAKKIKNVVTVSATGGYFTNPVAASNPFLLQIGPGFYTLAQPLVMKPYVPVIPA